MGEKDSSKTRVQPVFKGLFNAKNTDWIVSVLELFPQEKAEPLSLNPGTILKTILSSEDCFEKKLAPQIRFLEWMINNPSKLIWPKDDKEKKLIYSEETQNKRKLLIEANDKSIQNEALLELKKSGAAHSKNKWWAFEGFTSVDFLVETDKIVFAVEGKRTEPGPAKTVSWYSKRNQIVRNLEAVQQYADGRQYGVALIDESGTYQLSSLEIDESLPHLSQHERYELINHFLGSVTWKSVCSKTGIDYNSLPDTV